MLKLKKYNIRRTRDVWTSFFKNCIKISIKLSKNIGNSRNCSVNIKISKGINNNKNYEIDIKLDDKISNKINPKKLKLSKKYLNISIKILAKVLSITLIKIVS